MKLFAKYNRVLFLIVITGLLCIGLLFYQTLSYFLNRNINESLNEELMEVQDFTHVRNITPAPSDDADIVISYRKINRMSSGKITDDTTFYNTKKHIVESGRYLKTVIDFNGQPLQVVVIASKAARREQIKVISLIILLPVIMLLGVLVAVNRYMLAKIWHPFRQTLDQVKTFKVNSHSSFHPLATDVLEFRELNEAVSVMTKKIKNDYEEIKLFTENASHEMMTPIAIINSKLDTLLQSQSLQQADSQLLTDLYKATARLTKINQSLLLLVKIDNNLLQDEETIDVKDAIETKLHYFQELISKRNLTVQINLSEMAIVMSRHLFDIMLNNLFSNAIRHNYNGGTIQIYSGEGLISFDNTSKLSALNPNHIFERFNKDPTSEGTGLGLAILRQICNRQNFNLSYRYERAYHRFQIDCSCSSIKLNKEGIFQIDPILAAQA